MTDEWPAEWNQGQIRGIRDWLGRHVVVVFRKGGRIKKERRYDSASDSLNDLQAIQRAIGLFYPETPIGPELIGKGYKGLLPWDELNRPEGVTEAKRLEYSCPVRVADVVENQQIGITYIYMESV